MDVDAGSHAQDPSSTGTRTGDVQGAIQMRVSVYDAMVGQSQFTQRESRLALIEQELDEIYTSLTSLRRRRNSLIFASGCPLEVLSSIFRFLAVIEPSYRQNSEDYLDVVTGKLQPRLGYMKVTQVCYSWRTAAFEDGRLWTTVTTSFGMSWAREMLRLSKSFPVQLDLRSFGEPQESETSQLSLIAEQAHRLSHLQILCDESGGQRLRECGPIPAPLLETFKVFVRHSVTDLSQDLFASHTPLLRELYLHNVDVPKSLLSGNRTLTKLNLTLDVGIAARMPTLSLQELLAVVANLPELQYLCVKNHRLAGVADAGIEQHLSAPIHCPHLSDIVLHSKCAMAVILTYCRLLPNPGVRVSLSGFFGSSEISTFEQPVVLALFQQRMINNPISASMQTVEWRGHGVARVPIPGAEDRVDWAFERSLTLSAWRDNCSEYLLADYNGYPTPPTPDFRLTLGFMQWPTPNVIPEDVLRWQQTFPSAQSVSLQMSARFPFIVRNWVEMIRGFPQLQWLRLDRDIAQDFLLSVKKVPKSVKTLALLGVGWGREEEESPDKGLANIWRHSHEEGGALEEIIAGEVPVEGIGFADCLSNLSRSIRCVERPVWLEEGHEDWDNRTAW